MEYPNYYYEEPNGPNRPPKRRGAGGYVVTAVVFMIIGALLYAILMPGLYAGSGREPGEAPEASASPAFPFLPPIFPTANPEPTALPQITAPPTTRPMPSLDGAKPEIKDSVNPIPDIVEQVSSGVVGIVNYTWSTDYSMQLEQSSGSGFVISSDGYIVTNAHVIADSRSLSVMFCDGTEMEAEIIGMDKACDVAVLKVKDTGGAKLVPLKLGNSESARVGEFVIAIGDPTGRELAGTTTFGIISATARSVNIEGQTNTYIQTDAAVNPGNSGGPLINMAGEVIGITSAKTVTASYDEYGNAISAEGLGFALPINDALTIITQLITEGRVLRPGIGISVVTIDELAAKEYGVIEGMLVYSITKDGPGHVAGLKLNDIVVSIDGQSGLTQEQFVAYVKTKSVGDTITLNVWRAGKYLDIDLTLVDLNTLGSELAYGGYADYDFFGNSAG